jgi:hypothetical protein
MHRSSRLIPVLLLTACTASTPGARPTDMSASEHAAAAKAEDDKSAGHSADYDPKAATTPIRSGCGRATPAYDVPCWSDDTNPTDEHRKAAEEHRKMAADHRAGAKALADAEAKSCTGIDPDDRDRSPFGHRDDIVDVRPLEVTVGAGDATGEATTKRLRGALIGFRGVRGLTQQYLQRTMDCHLARNASMGFAMPEMSWCPLSVKGAKVTVTSGPDRFIVSVEAADDAAGAEILKRARALRP